MTNASADSDVCKDSSAAEVLAKERERNRKGGRQYNRISLRLMNDAYEICCAPCIPRARAPTVVHTLVVGLSFLAFRKKSW